MPDEMMLTWADGQPLAGEQVDSPSIQLPSFFVVGPPRTGTSWLHHVLARHANLPFPTKETRFFDCHFHRGIDWYRKHFPSQLPGRPTGEVAPTYFASMQARDAIAQTIPHAKLIFIFRDPVQRIISLYRVKRAYGLLGCDFEEALTCDPELLDSARYANFLEKWQEAFPREQMLVTLYDDLREAPQAYLDRLGEFLDIRCTPLTEREKRYVHASQRMSQPRSYVLTRAATLVADWCKARNLDHVVAAVRDSKLMELFLGGGAPFPEITPATLQKLYEAFRPEIDELERMIGRDLSMWQPRARRALAE